MHKELIKIADYTRAYGLSSLAHAQQHVVFSSMDGEYFQELGVLQSAHAAETIIKAKIAEQHPLLVFSDIPRLKQFNECELNLRTLFEETRTLQYDELPERLWMSTGYKIKDYHLYQHFGRLKNSIQYFKASEKQDLVIEAIEFIYRVIDPMIYDFWGLYAVDYIEDLEAYEDIFEILQRLNIPFLTHPKHNKN